MAEAQNTENDEMADALNRALADSVTYELMGILGRMTRVQPDAAGGPGDRPGGKEPVQVHAGRGQPGSRHRDSRAAFIGLSPTGSPRRWLRPGRFTA